MSISTIVGNLARAGCSLMSGENTLARFESTLGRNTGNRLASLNILFIVRTVGKIVVVCRQLALIYKQPFIFSSWNGKQRGSDAGPWECYAMIGQLSQRSQGQVP